MTDQTKPKARRRKDARPSEIIDAGIAEFTEHGFQGARLDRIARSAGIAKGTIYLYYPSKEALFLAAVEEHVVRVMSEGEMQVAGFDGSTEDLLVALLGNLYDQVAKGRAQTLLRILIAEGHRIPDLVAQYHEMAIKRGTLLIKRILERGIARGDVRKTAVLDHPQLVIAPAIFFALHSMMFGAQEELDPDSYFRAHIALVLHGILER